MSKNNTRVLGLRIGTPRMDKVMPTPDTRFEMNGVSMYRLTPGGTPLFIANPVIGSVQRSPKGANIAPNAVNVAPSRRLKFNEPLPCDGVCPGNTVQQVILNDKGIKKAQVKTPGVTNYIKNSMNGSGAGLLDRLRDVFNNGNGLGLPDPPVGDGSCPTGQVKNSAGVCVDIVQPCPTGQTRNNAGVCVNDNNGGTTCGIGQIFDQWTRTCVTDTTIGN